MKPNTLSCLNEMQKASSCGSVTSYQTSEIRTPMSYTSVLASRNGFTHREMSGLMKNRTGKIKGRRNRLAGYITLIRSDLLSSINLVMQLISPNKSFDINLMGCGRKTGMHHKSC